MKAYSTIKFAVALFAGVSLFTGCRDEHLLEEGEGRMMLHTSVMNDIKVVSRALAADEIADLSAGATIWISDPKKGRIHSFTGLGSFPTEGLPLEVGSYVAEAWLGDSVPASWDKKRFKGLQEFQISKGINTQVDLVCHIRNTLVSVSYDKDLDEVLGDYKLTVSLNDGVTDGSHSLTFEGKTTDKGYFMLNSRTKGLTWKLEGTDLTKNEPFVKEDVFQDATVAEAPYLSNATEYKIFLKYDSAGEIQIGGAYFSIEIEPEPIEGELQEIYINIAPDIKGVGFKISEPLVVVPGEVGRRSLYVTTSSAIDSIGISGSLLEALGAAYHDGGYNLINMEDTHRDELAGIGVEYEWYNRNESHPDLVTNMRLNFAEEALNALSEGTYELQIGAKDTKEQVTVKTFVLEVSAAPVQANPVAESSTTFTSATLSAKVLDPTASGFGFELRQTTSRAYEDWTPIAATVADGVVTATVNNLVAGTTYEYRVIATKADGSRFEGKTMTFSTVAYPQLPNAGFEDWSGSAPMLVYSGDASNMFWDSGNHGSKTMGKDITEFDTSIYHGGSRSARLQSQFVGIGAIGKFAAGNIFVGKYLKTDGTDGVLGWGRPWNPDARPKALKGWAKYSPGTIDKSKVFDKVPSFTPEEIKAEFPAGGQDKGIIYIALVDHSVVDSEYPDFPVIVKTKVPQLFDKNGSYVKAYGEIVFSEATAGDGMVEFTINLNEVNPGAFTHLMIVASASKAGDYFLGGEGSTLWIDDLELVY